MTQFTIAETSCKSYEQIARGEGKLTVPPMRVPRIRNRNPLSFTSSQILYNKVR